MSSYKKLAIVMGCWLAVFGVLGHIHREESLPEPPASTEEAISRIASTGLFVSGASRSGLAGTRLIDSFTVSRTVITEEETSSLHPGRSKEDWQGKVRIYRDSPYASVRIDPPDYLKVVRWGDKFLVLGDPDLIRDIVNLAAKSPRD